MRTLPTFAGLLLSASLGFGQTSFATVTGTITDPAGAVVANAPVSLKNVENGQVYVPPVRTPATSRCRKFRSATTI